MKVSEVMTQEVRSIHPQRGLPEAALVMRKYDLGCLPVTQGKKLVGIVTDRDLALRAIGEGRDLATSLIDDVMTKTVVYVYDDQEVEEAIRLMSTAQVRRLPVLNREGKLVGILALADLALDGFDPKVAGQMLRKIAQPVPPDPTRAD
jgi:CBS domain-containing protein